MENSNIIKQAKSDIFKELYPIIKFYISKGAQPKALKKYYKTKRFYDILEDIKNKGINLIEDEKEYHKLVRETLNEILDDFIAKEKDDNYKKNMDKKMKNLKTFESFQLNEDAHWLLLGAGGISLLIFLKKLFKDIKERKSAQKYIDMTPQEREEYKKQIHKNLEDVNFRILNRYISDFFKNNGEIKFSENYLYYFFDLGDLRIRIDKRNKTIQWNYLSHTRTLNYIVRDKNKFIDPIPVSEEEIKSLIDSLKEKTIEENE